MSGKLRLSEQFRLRFEQLRSATNDNPQTLLTFFQEKPEFERLAREVKIVADLIEKAADHSKAYKQVSPGFISDLKNYTQNWRSEVAYVDQWPLLSLDLLGDDSSPPTFEEFKKTHRLRGQKSGPDTDWDESFDPSEHDGATAIHEMISLAAEQGANRRRDTITGDDDFIANTFLIGAEAFEYFEKTIGIDVEAAFRRWNKLPAVYVPKHVSDRHGTEKGSLYALLDEAVRAYVAGASGAAIALCRALLETILRDHYMTPRIMREEGLKSDAKLGRVVHIAAERYRFLSKTKLDALRKGANTVLHQYSASGEIALEDEEKMLQFFKDLKFYIERAPDK